MDYSLETIREQMKQINKQYSMPKYLEYVNSLNPLTWDDVKRMHDTANNLWYAAFGEE